MTEIMLLIVSVAQLPLLFISSLREKLKVLGYYSDMTRIPIGFDSQDWNIFKTRYDDLELVLKEQIA